MAGYTEVGGDLDPASLCSRDAEPLGDRAGLHAGAPDHCRSIYSLTSGAHATVVDPFDGRIEQDLDPPSAVVIVRQNRTGAEESRKALAARPL
jgi:hypothetical protein